MRGPTLAFAFALAFALPAFVPSASADHVYSHRYVVYARVVDEHDRPVPNVSVALDFPETVEGSCNPQPRNATSYFGNTITRNVSDANGFVIFCDHVHALSPQTPTTATLSGGGKSVSWTADFETRADFETLVIPGAASVDPAPGIVVAARVWRATEASILIEGIPVFGDTIKGVNVTVGAITSATNNYGDVSVLVEDPTVATIRVLNDTFPLTRDHGWAHAKVHEPALPPDLTLQASRFGDTCWWHTPGNDTRNPDHAFAAGKVADILIDNQQQNVTIIVGTGSLSFAPKDMPVIIPFSPPPGNKTTYACQPGGVPSGHLVWGAPTAANDTPPSSTPTTSTPTATGPTRVTGIPAPGVALVVAIAAVLAFARIRKAL